MKARFLNKQTYSHTASQTDSKLFFDPWKSGNDLWGNGFIKGETYNYESYES